MVEESLCKTCTNIFDFPECCEENLEERLQIVSGCRNYNKCGFIRDCLSCSNSHSEPQEHGDILHCTEQSGRIVEENGFCNKWN